MLQLWRLDLRQLALARTDRFAFSLMVAVKSRSEADAVQFARTHIHTSKWWDRYIITDVVPMGELWCAEGFVVPQGDID
jgi:hypothetical protein